MESKIEPKRIQAANFQYVPVEWNNVNESGFEPLGDSVVVLTDVAPEQSTGKVFITASQQLSQQMMAETGVIVAIAAGAFKWLADRTRPWEGYQPVPGDRIVFERYAGRQQTGLDGRDYRIMSDRCIAALLKTDKTLPATVGPVLEGAT